MALFTREACGHKEIISMWDSWTHVWRTCFEQAWAAHCAGSAPIGAVIVDTQSAIIGPAATELGTPPP
jgi:hypothetical protein